MTAPLAPTPAGATGAPVDPATLNNGEGDAPLDRVVKQDDGTPDAVKDASRAFRERLEKAAQDADAATAAAAGAPPAEPTDGQPRNKDGTFAPKDGDAAPPAAADETPTDETVAEEPPEPKVFVLKGETQRGEQDIELDVTGLPQEVLDRLERSEKQGMRAAEYKQAQQKLRADRSNLDAIVTEMSVDPDGFILNNIAPARRASLAQTLLLDQWDALAPMIEELWQDEAGRLRRIGEITAGIKDRQGNVQREVQGSRAAADIRAAVGDLVPETADDAIAADFFQTSIALLQARAMRNEPVTAESVATLLKDHRRRFFGADAGAAPSTPPARPKLAVKPRVATPAATPSPTTVIPQDAVKLAMQRRAAALATAGQGAGAGAVQRPSGPADETIEQASKRIRAQAGR